MSTLVERNALIESFGGRSAYRVLRQVESLTFDTAARVLAYQKFTKRLSRIFSKKVNAPATKRLTAL